MKHLLPVLLTVPLAVFAHDGHGQSGTHWHATDAWGFVALAIALGVAIWFSRRK